MSSRSAREACFLSFQGSRVLFPLRLLFRHGVVMCVLLVSISPRRTDLRPPRAHVNAGFTHKILFEERALFDGASPTSLVIRSNGPDKWGLDSCCCGSCSPSSCCQAVRLGAGRRGSGALPPTWRQISAACRSCARRQAVGHQRTWTCPFSGACDRRAELRRFAAGSVALCQTSFGVGGT